MAVVNAPTESAPTNPATPDLSDAPIPENELLTVASVCFDSFWILRAPSTNLPASRVASTRRAPISALLILGIAAPVYRNLK
jgi:hypothetical protein